MLKRQCRFVRLLVAIGITCSTLLLASCAATKDTGPLIVAHRGASYLAPENTLASFNLAWQLGADLIEGDFYLSQDGVIVSHHDDTTERTAGVDVALNKQTFAELRALDVGAWKDPKWMGERIPTLRDVMATVPKNGSLLIEIKTDARIVPALATILEQCDLRRNQLIVICFDEHVIAQTKNRLPWIKALWLSGFKEESPGQWTPTVDKLISTAKRIRADGVDLNANLDVIDQAFVARVREADLELHVWTVNDPEIAKLLIDLGVDSITTDRPGWLREELDQRR